MRTVESDRLVSTGVIDVRPADAPPPEPFSPLWYVLLSLRFVDPPIIGLPWLVWTGGYAMHPVPTLLDGRAVVALPDGHSDSPDERWWRPDA